MMNCYVVDRDFSLHNFGLIHVHCADYGVESVEVGARLATVEQTLSILDTGLEEALYQLPSRISSAGEDILSSIRGDNHDYGRWGGIALAW